MTSPFPPAPSHPSSSQDRPSLPPPATRPSASPPSSSSGHATPSTESGQGTLPGASARPTRADADDEADIEMDSLAPAGHRRRRSSLMSSRPGRAHPRTPSTGSQSRAQDGSRIPEEGSEGDDTDGDLSDEDLHDDEETGLTGKDRRRRQTRKRHNTRLDNRIASDRITAEEVKEADQNVVKRLATNFVLILLWYLFSLSISLVSLPPLPPPLTSIEADTRTCSTTSGCSTSESSTSASPCL